MSNRNLLVVLFLLVTSTFAFNQSHDVSAEVLDTEHQIADAWKASEVDKLSSFILDDYRGTTHRGHVVDKAALLKFIAANSGGAGAGTAKYEEEKVWVHGEVAVYTVRVTDSWTDEKGKPQQLTTQATDILVRQNGQWKVKFSQETPVQ